MNGEPSKIGRGEKLGKTPNLNLHISNIKTCFTKIGFDLLFQLNSFKVMVVLKIQNKIRFSDLPCPEGYCCLKKDSCVTAMILSRQFCCLDHKRSKHLAAHLWVVM